jgi:hypothetical protein
MKKIEVEISGDAILMHSPKAMLEGDNSSKMKMRSSVKDYDPKEEAEKGAYRMKSGELYVPAEAIFGSMLRGASFKKAGKYAAKSVMAGNVRVEPREIGLGTKDYEIDIRTVVLNRKARIVRARACVKDWKIKFNIIYNDEMIAQETIKSCLEDAGSRIGILDFRPATSGSFGTFKIDKFKA